jgi:hypothetical protein
MNNINNLYILEKRQGFWKQSYVDGQTVEMFYLDDKVHGLWMWFNANNEIVLIRNCVFGEIEGEEIKFY